MKIQVRTFFNNILAGLLPLVLVSVIFLVTYNRNSREFIKNNMEISINNLKMFLEEDLEKYRTHALFLARENYQVSRSQAINSFRLDEESIFGIRQKLRMTEVFIESANVFRDMARWRDHVYTTQEEEAAALWKKLSQEQYSRRYVTSIPVIRNGVLVYRNCAILYQKDRNKKLGFVSFSLPLDISYFQDFNFQDPGAIYFIQTDEDIIFSDPTFQNEQVKRPVLDELKNEKILKYLRLDKKGNYYIHRSTYLPVVGFDDDPQRKAWTYLGVLYNEEKLNNHFLSFQRMYRLSMVMSLFLVGLLAIWFSNSLIRPIKQLQIQVKEFERSYQKIVPPMVDKDEISQLQSSIARMSEHILINKQIIEEERNHLRKKQENQLSELEMARNIQTNLLPKTSPWPNLSFFFQPMEEVSGDFFEFQELSTHEIGIFIADVSGHGVPAAFITAMLKSFTLQNNHYAKDPYQYMRRCNQFLLNNIGSNFITALYGVYNKKKRSFDYCNAGHLEPLVIRKDSIFSPFDGQRGPCLGIFSDNDLEHMNLSFNQFSLQLKKGDRVLLYTDGFIETVTYQRESQQHIQDIEFGDRELSESIFSFLDSHHQHLIPYLVERLKMFRQAPDYEDDICIINLDIE